MSINTFLNVGTSWNTGANWSLGTVPTSSDVATFNAGSGNCTLDANANVAGIDIQATYTNTFTQGAGFTIDVGSSNLNMANGVFAGGDSYIHVSTGSINISGGAFKSTSSSLKARSSITFANATFTHNNGLVGFLFSNGGQTLDLGTNLIYDLEIVNNTTFNAVIVVGTINLVNDLEIGNGGKITGGVIEVKGDLNVTGARSPVGGSTVIRFVGTNIQAINSVANGVIYAFDINKTGGSVTLYNDLGVDTFNYTAGTLDQNGFAFIVGNSNNSPRNITAGSYEFGKLTLQSGSFGGINIIGNCIVNGVFDIGVCPSLDGGTISLKGDVISTENIMGGNCVVTVDGTVDQNFSISSLTNRFTDLGFIINKASGKIILLESVSLVDSSQDLVVEKGTLDMGALDFKMGGDLNLNGGAITSTTGVLTFAKHFLASGIFDPFKAVSDVNTGGTHFTDSATLNFMASGGDFEFSGSGHWTIDQNFTEFPHLIFNHCPICTQSGQFSAQDVTLLNGSGWGGGSIRGNLTSSGFSTTSLPSKVTFDGAGAQVVTGEVSFYTLEFNKVSGSVVFNDDFRLAGCNVLAGASLVDFGTSLCHILSTGNLFAVGWQVLGLEFYDLELEINSVGSATLDNTVALNDFTLTQASSLQGDILVGGNFTVNDTSINLLASVKLNGVTDQRIYIEGGFGNNINNPYEIDKSMGIVALDSDLGKVATPSTLDLLLTNGVLCTNGYDITMNDITLDVGTVIQKVSPTVITATGVITNNGAIVDIAGCSTGIVV